MGNGKSSDEKLDAGTFSDDEFENLRKWFEKCCDGETRMIDERRFESRFQSEETKMKNLFGAIDFEEKKSLDLKDFRDGVAACCGRTRSEAQFYAFLEACDVKYADRTISLDGKDLTILFRKAFSLSLVARLGYDAVKRIDMNTVDVSRLVSSVMSGRTSIRVQDFLTCCTYKFQSFSKTFGTYMYLRFRLCSENELSSSRVFQWPRIEKGKRTILKKMDMFALGLASETLQCEWQCLYDVDHGRSFERLCFDVMGYTGPTLFVIRDKEGNVFGALAETPWSEDAGEKKFFGSPNTFLFALRPTVKILRPGSSCQMENYQYINRKGYSSSPGLGFGGSIGNFRLFICADFGTDKCKERTIGVTTFERGRLRSSRTSEFMIETLEVWGLGGDDAMSAQSKERQESSRIRQQMRKVDKARLLDDFTKEFMLGKTFGKDINSEMTQSARDCD